jgi:putative membrane protein
MNPDFFRRTTVRNTFLKSSIATAAFALFILGTGVTRADTADASDADKTFVATAASGGMAELKLGKYAEDNGSSENVKKFGKRMAKDHTKANKELEAIAKKHGIDVPTDLSADDAAIVDTLMKMNGADFDKAYAAAMVSDHQKTIDLFTEEAKNGTVPDLKKFASDTIPTLQKHLAMSQKMVTAVAEAK